MPTQTTENTFPLRQMRMESGVAVASILEQGKALTSQFPRSPEALYMIEKRGTRNYDVILALATIYQKPQDAVANAAR